MHNICLEILYFVFFARKPSESMAIHLLLLSMRIIVSIHQFQKEIQLINRN